MDYLLLACAAFFTTFSAFCGWSFFHGYVPLLSGLFTFVYAAGAIDCWRHLIMEVRADKALDKAKQMR